jgi:hypothetical protein
VVAIRVASLRYSTNGNVTPELGMVAEFATV